MSKSVQMLAAGVLLFLAVLAASPLGARADEPADQGPVFRHALVLRVRGADEKEWSDKTKTVEVEFFLDGPKGNGVYLGDAGDLAVVPAKLVAPEEGKVKPPDWSHGMSLGARKAGDKEFTKDTKHYGVEVFVDANNGNYLYITDTKAMAVVPGVLGAAKAGEGVKAPEWKKAADLRVRKAGERDFNDKTPKIGVETFLDPNNGNIVYISETGSIAVLPAKLAKMDPSQKEPDWKYGLEMDARKANEQVFSKDTKRYGVEVFYDAFTGAVLYVGETGAVAVAPASLCTVPDNNAKVQGPDWKQAMKLACRRPDEADFTKDTKRYGVEVFRDPNTGNTIYLSETGALSVVPAKDPA